MASLITNAIGKWHRHHQSKRLMQFGLMWHDVVADGPILDKAVARLPKEMQERRERRIRRAFDLSLKHKYLPEDKWVDPYAEFDMMDKLMKQVQIEEDERKHLNDEYWNTYFSTNKWYSYDKDQVWFWKPEELAGASQPTPKSLR